MIDVPSVLFVALVLSSLSPLHDLLTTLYLGKNATSVAVVMLLLLSFLSVTVFFVKVDLFNLYFLKDPIDPYMADSMANLCLLTIAMNMVPMPSVTMNTDTHSHRDMVLD